MCHPGVCEDSPASRERNSLQEHKGKPPRPWFCSSAAPAPSLGATLANTRGQVQHPKAQMKDDVEFWNPKGLQES